MKYLWEFRTFLWYDFSTKLLEKIPKNIIRDKTTKFLPSPQALELMKEDL